MDRSKTFEQLQQDVYAYLDGELEPNDMASYDELIQSDKRAKEFVDEIVVFEGELKSLELVDGVEPPKDSWSKFQSRLHQDQMNLDIQLPEAGLMDSIRGHLSNNWMIYGLAAAASMTLLIQPPKSNVDKNLSLVKTTQIAVNSNQREFNESPKFTEVEVPKMQVSYEVKLNSEKVVAKIDDGSMTNDASKGRESKPDLDELPSLEKVLINEEELNAMVTIEVDGTRWAIDKFPVTNKEYADFVRETGHQPPFHWEGSDYRSADEAGLKPVTYVSFMDAKSFCEWENKRLPNQAEWELAAGRDKGSKYPWGDSFSAKFANTREAGIGLVDVGSFPMNVSPHGVYEMSGNVRQWVDQDFAEGSSALFAKPGQHKMMKGGSFMDTADKASISHSISGDKETIYGNTGIRCVSDRS